MGFRYSFSTPTFQAKPETRCGSYALATSPVGAVQEINLSKDILLNDSAMKQVYSFNQDIESHIGISFSKNVSVHQTNSCVARKSQTTGKNGTMSGLPVLHDRNCTRPDVGMNCSNLSHTSFH